MLNEIYERQSIRKYVATTVESEKLESLLRAAMNAPSARNTQSTRYMVITNRKALDDMISLQPYMTMMKEAPCAILILGDTTTIEPQEYLYVNASAAIENLLIEAQHQGLSTCWCAIGPMQERIDQFRAYYQLQEHLLPIAAIAVGYGNEEKAIIDRFDEQKITYYK